MQLLVEITSPDRLPPRPMTAGKSVTLLGVLLFLFAQAPTVDAISLKIATLSPDGTSWMTAMRKGGREIRERTNGRVELRFFPGGVMGNEKSMLRKIRVGQLHGGAITGGGLASIYPNSQIYSLPFLFRSTDEVEFVRSHIDKAIIGGLKEEGFVSFGISGGGFAYLLCQKPLDNVEKLKQQKVWAPEGDRISLTAFQALGISPIPLPLTDVLTGLQTGLVDTVSISPIGAIALQWHTRVKYLTDVPLMYLYGTLVIKKSIFDRLSPSDREVTREVLERVFREINAQNIKDNTDAKEALRNQGIDFVYPTDSDMMEWRGIVREAIRKISRDAGFSDDLLGRMHRLLEEYRNKPQTRQSLKGQVNRQSAKDAKKK